MVEVEAAEVVDEVLGVVVSGTAVVDIVDAKKPSIGCPASPVAPVAPVAPVSPVAPVYCHTNISNIYTLCTQSARDVLSGMVLSLGPIFLPSTLIFIIRLSLKPSFFSHMSVRVNGICETLLLKGLPSLHPSSTLTLRTTKYVTVHYKTIVITVASDRHRYSDSL